MRVGIIADIHANLAAFQAVLEDIKEKGGVDEYWCLGDVVGYGPDPVACIQLLQEIKADCVIGNHDLGAIGGLDIAYFNPYAAAACEWTSRQLTGAEKFYLENMPRTMEKGDFYLVHGSPASPMMEYVLSTSIASKNFDSFSNTFCLVGHSHVPLAYRQEGGKAVLVTVSPNIGLVLRHYRMIINPGSVGQPRDGDPRASYAVYDSEAHMLRLHRVDYDIRATQDRMVRAGLPLPLIARLEVGR